MSSPNDVVVHPERQDRGDCLHLEALFLGKRLELADVVDVFACKRLELGGYALAIGNCRRALKKCH